MLTVLNYNVSVADTINVFLFDICVSDRTQGLSSFTAKHDNVQFAMRVPGVTHTKNTIFKVKNKISKIFLDFPKVFFINWKQNT